MIIIELYISKVYDNIMVGENMPSIEEIKIKLNPVFEKYNEVRPHYFSKYKK